MGKSSKNALQLRLQYMTAARLKMTHRLWVPMALWKPHYSVFTTALLTHAIYWWGAEKHTLNHQWEQDLHKHRNRTANNGSHGSQGNTSRRSIEVRADKYFPRFQESRITYLEKHKCCIKTTWLDTWLFHICPRHYILDACSKTINKN